MTQVQATKLLRLAQEWADCDHAFGAAAVTSAPDSESIKEEQLAAEQEFKDYIASLVTAPIACGG